MEKNYYEILQINQNASPEIIDKAYKTLAKKYHPDLQNESNKKHYEEILKQINEAYEILSNPEKRKQYDQSLQSYNISQEDYQAILRQNQILKNELMKKQQNDFSSNNNNPSSANYQQPLNQQYQEELQNAKQKAYYDAYIQDLKNRGYKIRYKKNFKDYLKNFYAFVFTIVFLFILWHIPFIHKYLLNLYDNNPILKDIINRILSIF